METLLQEAVKELLDFIEENDISDEHNIKWIDKDWHYIENNRSLEFKEIIQKVRDAIDDE